MNHQVITIDRGADKSWLGYVKRSGVTEPITDCTFTFRAYEGGWKGTLLGIAKRTIETAKERLGCEPEDFTVWFGPSIRSCCYRISDDVAILFDDECFQPSAKQGATLDLIGINRKQLLDCGVKDKRMFTTNCCTCCDDKLFYSYRREKENTSRMVGFLGLI